MKKKSLFLLVAFSLLCIGLAVAQPAPPHGKPIQVRVSGQDVQFEAPPMERGGTVVVPMRQIFQRLGAVVHFDTVTRSVKALKGRTVVVLRLGDPVAYVNLKPRPLQVPAFMHEGKIFVPLRFVSEALGAAVMWDPAARVVHIAPSKKEVSTLPRIPIPGRTTVPVTASSPTPSAAPSPSPSPSDEVAIREFYHNARGPIAPGDELVVTLVGTPGGQARFFVEGGVEDVEMKEVSPGTYGGSHRFAAGTKLGAARVHGTLQVGAKRAPLATAASPLTVEPPRPHVAQPEPPANSVTNVTTPRITAFFETLGATLDPKVVKIRVNGVDVTARATVNSKFFVYVPEKALPPGKNQVEVEVGAAWKDGWSFEVQSGAAISAVTHGAERPLQAGDTLNVTLVGTPGGKATFDIGSYRAGNAMRETGVSGTYTGSYTVTAQDRIDNAPIIAHLQVTGQPAATAQAPRAVTLGSGAAPSVEVSLSVTVPRPDDKVDAAFQVRGQTAPNARVEIVVTQVVPIVGTVQVAKAQATAGTDGKFSADVRVRLAVAGSRYLLSVAAVDPAGAPRGPFKFR